MGNPADEKISFPTPEAQSTAQPPSYDTTTSQPAAAAPAATNITAAPVLTPAPAQPAPVAAAPTNDTLSRGVTDINEKAPAPAAAAPAPVPVQGNVICPNCQNRISPQVKKEVGTKTLLWSVAIGLICFPLMCIPCCIDDLKESKFYCPQCNVCLSDFPKALMPQLAADPNAQFQQAQFQQSPVQQVPAQQFSAQQAPYPPTTGGPYAQ